MPVGAGPGRVDRAARRRRAVVAGLDGARAGAAAADLDRPVRYPWPEPRSLAQAAAWANQELMKNVAEIGQLRDLHGRLTGGRHAS
jgi:hypothetical protein